MLPTQRIPFIREDLNSQAGRAFLPEERFLKIQLDIVRHQEFLPDSNVVLQTSGAHNLSYTYKSYLCLSQDESSAAMVSKT